MRRWLAGPSLRDGPPPCEVAVVVSVQVQAYGPCPSFTMGSLDLNADTIYMGAFHSLALGLSQAALSPSSIAFDVDSSLACVALNIGGSAVSSNVVPRSTI